MLHLRMALLWALGMCYVPRELIIKSSCIHRVEYFQAAERQLNKETESAHLTSIQAILGECFYILTCSRLNHCWSLFGTASRLIVALGLHRKSTRLDNPINYIEAECR